jgi:hypothetical protein
MAGYSATPLPQKLGIKEGHRVALIQAPAGFREVLGTLPTGATIATRGMFDVLVVFVTLRAELVAQLAAARPRMQQAAGLWIAWPKQSSGVATEVTENLVRELALPTGLVDNKVCAIDATWSGLRLVIRRELRTAPAKPPRRASARSTGR